MRPFVPDNCAAQGTIKRCYPQQARSVVKRPTGLSGDIRIDQVTVFVSQSRGRRKSL